jgi:hypothetical protein
MINKPKTSSYSLDMSHLSELSFFVSKERGNVDCITYPHYIHDKESLQLKFEIYSDQQLHLRVSKINYNTLCRWNQNMTKTA